MGPLAVLTRFVSSVLHLRRLQPRQTPCSCSWVLFSHFSGLPGWLHPLCRSLFSDTWLIPVGCFLEICAQSNPSQVPSAECHSTQCAVFCFSVSPSTRPFTSCCLCLCVSSLCLPTQCWHTGGAQGLLNEGLVTWVYFL